MNEVVMFDTHEAFKDIHKGGSFTEEQADVLVKAMGRFVASHNADLASKGDVLAVKADVLAVKADVENLRVSNKRDLAELEVRMVKWVVAVGAIFLSALTAATIYLASIGTEILTRLN